ncbi:hypothetical protein ACPWSR_06665 [Alloiococcus sp. CFN-8]|uniref:hypothetical protein n=1 Tax=Alloiococcus sp. CFN-8 TaxID=3416081 RepID=UPI003CF831BA
MKRSYVKPIMDVECFAPNIAIAASCNRLPAGTEYDYEAQTVDCVVTTSDTIFTAGTSGCDHEVDPNGSGTTYKFITYNGQLYFAWVGPSGGGGGGGDMKLLNNILKAGGISSVNAGNRKVWHAGPANAKLTQLYSHSY